MLSYVNFYGVEPGTERYEIIAEKNIIDMLYIVAGKDRGADLTGIDWKEAAEQYLISHGMSAEAIETLEAKLK